jgi:predicted porin
MQKKLIALAVAEWLQALPLPRPTSPCTVFLTWPTPTVQGTPAATLSASRFRERIPLAVLPASVPAIASASRAKKRLGNGLKAVFTLEYGLDPDLNCGIGTCGLNARQQFVGLASNYGTVALGRQYAPGFNATANNDALDASDFAIQSSLSAINGMTITPNSPARFNNAITYTSPRSVRLQGQVPFTASARPGMLLAATTTSGSAYSRITVSTVLASTMPMVRSISTRSGNPVPMSSVPTATPPYELAGTDKSINEWYVGGSYDFKVVKALCQLPGSRQQEQKGCASRAYRVSGIDSSDLWTVGLTAPIGRGTLGLSYGRLTTDRNYGLSDGVSWGAGTQYTYPLSKRTSLVWQPIAISATTTTCCPATLDRRIAIPGIVGATGESNYALGTGITHSF